MPRSFAARTSLVRMGLKMTSTSPSSRVKRDRSISLPLESAGISESFGNMPRGVVLMMICASPCCSYACSYVTAPFLLSLRTVIISDAPRSSETAFAVLDVPPLPKMRTFLPLRESPICLISISIPPKSVLYPRSFRENPAFP